MRSVGECGGRPNSKNPRCNTGTWGTPGEGSLVWPGRSLSFGWSGEIAGELEAVVQRRVGVEPDDYEFWRIGIVKIFFAEDLEGMGGDFIGVGKESLN